MLARSLDKAKDHRKEPWPPKEASKALDGAREEHEEEEEEEEEEENGAAANGLEG